MPCPREICNRQGFEDIYAWLNHAAAGNDLVYTIGADPVTRE